MNISEINMQSIVDMIIPFGIKIVLALVIYIVGKWVVGIVSNFISKAMNARNVDPTISKFVGSIIYYLMLAFVILAALGQLGVETASAIAIIGAAGLAVGFALQGTLSNFAAGVMLILLRPIKVGDFVEVAGESGVVSEVAIFATTLLTGDNKTVIAANASVMGGNITNYSTQPERRVDLVVGVGYGSNIEQVKTELQAIAAADDRILHDKGTTIGVSELADSSVNLVFRNWVKSGDYWPVYFALNERIKIRFDEVGIEIPFPQMDVHGDSAV
jgi:small conductance mechanosensitive channel